MDRVALLTEVLSQNPTDAFARYGLAMEYSKAGEVERALEEFGKLLGPILITQPATSWQRKRWPRRSGWTRPERCSLTA